MKTMTCKQLGGACGVEFHAETFDEMSSLCKKHGVQMSEDGDEDHISAMQKMGELMHDPEVMQKWLDSKRKEFESLPEDR